MAQLRIFVSHSSHDNAWCRPFADALKAIGYNVWYDETGLQGGAAWVDSIQREVENRDVFLLVLTPEAWESKWVQDELQLAIATRRRILPVLLRNTQVSGFLLTTQWITVIGEEPQSAARAAIMAIEAPPAPGRDAAAPQAETETLDDLLTLCRSLLAERRFTEALAASSRALALDPANAEAFRLRGNVLLQIDEPYKAAESWGRALSLVAQDHTRKWMQDVVWSLQSHAKKQNPSRYDHENLDYLKSLTSQLSSGAVLYTLFEDFVRGNERFKLAPSISDASLLLAVFAIAKERRLSMKPGDNRNGNLNIVWDLARGRYGYPPNRATAADVDGLRYYKEVFDEWGDAPKSAVIEGYIERLLSQS